MGQLDTPDLYEYRGKVAKTRFETGCLEEDAQVFETVGVDASYYNFPRREFLEGLAGQVPDDLRFDFKFTDTITFKKFLRLDRLRVKAGQPKADFLIAKRFASSYLTPTNRFYRLVTLQPP